MATNTHRIIDDRQVIEFGTSQGFTVGPDQLQNAGIPLGTEVVVHHLSDQPGIKLRPPQSDEVYHRTKLREVIEFGNSKGVTIHADDLDKAEIPVGSDITVISLDGERGLKVVPDTEK